MGSCSQVGSRGHEEEGGLAGCQTRQVLDGILLNSRDTDFADGRKLDAVDLWMVRGFGMLGASFCGLITMIDDSFI